MTSKQYSDFLRWVLRAGCVFMVIEGIYHGSGIRMAGVEAYWPESAVAFARLFMMLWASASLTIAVVCYFSQRYLEQAKPLLVLLALPAIVHAAMLLWLSLSPFVNIMPLSNLYAWIPFYEVWIRGEALLLTSYALYIAYGRWKKFI